MSPELYCSLFIRLMVGENWKCSGLRWTSPSNVSPQQQVAELRHFQIGSVSANQVYVLCEEPNVGPHQLKRNSGGKFMSRALRLNNNMITDMVGLTDTLTALIVHPTRLAWLDLSFNDISHIHPVLTQLVELRVLYLHGNKLSNLSEVDKLGLLPILHTVTLHGNGMEKERSYRRYVISALPHLKTMDFSVITKQERAMASIWQRGGKGRKPARHGTQH